MEVLFGSREVGHFEIVNQNHMKNQYITFPNTETQNTLTQLVCLQFSEEPVTNKILLGEKTLLLGIMSLTEAK